MKYSDKIALASRLHLLSIQIQECIKGIPTRDPKYYPSEYTSLMSKYEDLRATLNEQVSDTYTLSEQMRSAGDIPLANFLATL